MEISGSEGVNQDNKGEYPYAVCLSCNTVQDKPILDSGMHTFNITCSKCKNKFCSYCGGDRHIFASCRKPMPIIRRLSDQYRV
ncbi:hypothetical protein SteCoe_23186 [Stentor coeruleus]|uniref:IBR domain-containing protein n=1 Tax=Stentor coeruleus TaxID=5963 RepID=A0A1R2BH15_9CILI|nr:hypothetical protein SteCoe_24701 [Stentor coeruleus]OMJ77276.1 hypothetical protein SteCoe_23186 [Stentor coeruleus]